MQNFLVVVKYNDPYPKQFENRAAATNIATATARALKAWKKSVGRSRIKSIVVSITKL